MEQNEFIEACEILERLVQALGGGLFSKGYLTLCEGYEKDDSKLKELGVKMILLEGNVMARIIAYHLLEDGTA